MAFGALNTGAPAPRPQLDAGQAINIQFTSGTTGLPKGATLSHTNLLYNAVCSTAAMQMGATDRLCIPVPLYHCFGMVLGVLACVVTGATMVFPGPSFDAAKVLDCVQQSAAPRCMAFQRCFWPCLTTQASTHSICRGCARGSYPVRRARQR